MTNKKLLADETLHKNLIESVRNNDIKNLRHYLEEDTNPHRLFNGMTLLDQALLLQRYEVADYLEKIGLYRKLSDTEIAKIRHESKERKPGKFDCKIVFELDANNQYSLKFDTYDSVTKDFIQRVTLSSEELLQKKLRKENIVISNAKDGKKNIFWIDSEQPSKINAVFQLDEEGEIHVAHLHQDIKDLTLSTPGTVHLDHTLSVGTLNIHANHLNIQENTLIEGAQCHFTIKGDILQQGNLNLSTLSAECDNYEHRGQTCLLNEFNLTARGRFNQHQTLMSQLGGTIHANVLENHRNSVIRVAEGKLHLYGKAAVKNSGSIVSDYLTLDSRYLINNYLGAHISAITCIIPPNASQFNNSGFYLVGRKASQTAWDKALNVAYYGIQAAGMLSLAPQAILRPMQVGLELSKLLLEGANILERISQGKINEISTDEWVHFFIDHVIPTIDLVYGAREKINFICSFLYQAYGWHLGEEAFIEKSLGILEIVLKGASRFSNGKFSPELIQLLEQTASTIENSKYVFKYANTATDILHAFSAGDRLAMQNAQDTLFSVSEIWFREGLYNLLPNKIFDLELSPRDLVLFITNKGLELSKEDLLQRGVSSAIYALHKSKYISDNAKADWQYGSHVVFSLLPNSPLMQKYQRGELTYSVAIEQALLQVATFASYRAQKNQLNKSKAAKVINDGAEPHIPESEETIGDEFPEIEIPEEDANTEAEVTPEFCIPDDEEDEREKNNPEPIIPDDEESEPESNSEPFDFDGLTIPDPEEVNDKIQKNAEKFRVEYEPKRLNLTLDVESIVENWLSAEPEVKVASAATVSWADSLSNAWEKGIQPEYASAFQEFLRVVRGECDFSQQGYLGVYAHILHNEGILDSTGNIGLNAENALNAGHIHASRRIELQGNDVANRDHENKVINRDLSKEGLSRFVNDTQGTLSADDSITTAGVGDVDNRGVLQTSDYKSAYGLKNHTNHGNIIAQNELDVRASIKALNTGVMSGKKVVHEGSLESSKNLGVMNAQEDIHHLSEKEVEQSESSVNSAKRVHLSASKVIKEGSIQAALVKTAGYDSERPDEVVWRQNDNDHMTGLVLNPKKTFDYDTDAFNQVQMTSLQLNADTLENDKLLNLSPDFNHTIALEVPESESTISCAQLPLLGEKGNFILHAPGATLEAMDSDKFEYGNELNFIGKAFKYNGENTFNKGGFDVETMTSVDGHTRLNLINGGTIQADTFINNGNLKSGGELVWNVKNLTNDVQTEYVKKHYFYSKENPEINTFYDRVAIEGSGTIHSEKNTGYIGNLEMTGGSLTSGKGGNYLYVGDATLKAFWGETSKYTLGYVEDKGRSWCHIAFALNAVIGSTGVNVLQGTGAMKIKGADIYGDDGNFVYFNGGIDQEKVLKAFKIHAAFSREKGKSHQTVEEQTGFIIAQNSINSNNGRIGLASADGSIKMEGIVASFESTDFTAKGSVILNGNEYIQTSTSKEKHHTIKGKETKTSQTEETVIDKSYLLIGGDLNVSASEFELSAVSGQVGNMYITALTTKLDGKEATYENKTTVKSVSIGLPTDNLVSLLNSHNSKAIFSTLIRNSGFDKEELNALIHAKSATEIPGHLITSAKCIWDLTAIASHACNAMGNKNIGELAGTITDQLGLTREGSNGKRTFNAKFTLKVSKTTEHTKQTSMVATDLLIGGTFRLEGNKLVIEDGSKIDAKNLIIALADGIEMTSGNDTYEYQKKHKEGSVGVQVTDPKNVDLSYAESSDKIKSVTHIPANLNAREGAYIKAGGAIVGEGSSITAKDGHVLSKTMSFETKQNTHEERHKSFSVAASSDITSIAQDGSASASYNNSKTSIARTDDKAGIFFEKGGNVTTNSVHLGGGSVLDLGEGVFQRADGQEGLPTVTCTDGYDHDYSSQTGFSAQTSMSSGTGMASGNYSKEKKETTHLASIYASNVKNGDLKGVNTDRALETQTTRDTRRGVSMAAVKLNPKTTARQKEEILSAGTLLMDKAKQGLHHLYPGKSNTLIYPNPEQSDLNTGISTERPHTEVPDSDVETSVLDTSVGDKETVESLGDNLTSKEPTLQQSSYEQSHEEKIISSRDGELEYTDASASDEQPMADKAQDKETIPSWERDLSYMDTDVSDALRKIPNVGHYLSQMSDVEKAQLEQIITDYQQGANNTGPQKPKAEKFDVELALNNIPDYLKYPMGKPSSGLANWFVEDQDSIIDGLLPLKYGPDQLPYMPLTPLLQPTTNAVSTNKSVKQMLESTINIRPIKGNYVDSFISGLQTYGLGDEHDWQMLNTNRASQIQYTTAEWFGLLLSSSLGERNFRVTQWQAFNRSKTPDEILKAYEGVRDSTIPINELPGIFGEAAVNAAVGLVEGGITTAIFAGKEIGRQFTGQELETIKAAKLLSTFVGEEKARFLMGQELEVTKIAIKLAQTFDQMDKRERVKGLAELAFSVAIPAGVTKIAGPAAELGGLVAGNIKLASNKALTYGYNTTIGGCPFSTKLPFKVGYNGQYNAYKMLFEPTTKINIPTDDALTFIGGKYSSYILKEDSLLWRAGDSEKGFGQFFSIIKPVSEIQSRIDSAILPVWPQGGVSILESAYCVKIPKGTAIHVGLAAPQGGALLGGTQQIYVKTPWTIKGAEIVKIQNLNEGMVWNQKARKAKK